MGHCRNSGGSHAARRHGFCGEALDELATAGSLAQADHAGAGAAGVCAPCRAGNASAQGNRFAVSPARARNCGSPQDSRRISAQTNRAARRIRNRGRVAIRARRGGDYFDVLPFDRDTFGLCIADVAGKGLPAAMLMSNLQAAVRGLASPSLAPEELCARLNALLCRNMANDRFVTLFYVQLTGPET